MTEIILASVITFFIIGTYLFIKKRKSKSMENIDNPVKEEEKSISQTISDFESRRSYVPGKNMRIRIIADLAATIQILTLEIHPEKTTQIF